MNPRTLLAPLLLLSLGLQPAAELRVEPDQNNVTAGRLQGRWEADPAVAERMGLKPSGRTLEFAPADDFLDQVPDELAEHLKELRFYESGVLTIRSGGAVRLSAPYLLTTIAGNPHLVYFRSRDGQPLGDVESANVFVAPGKERGDDLLLLGGDFDNQPFDPYRRVEGDE